MNTPPVPVPESTVVAVTPLSPKQQDAHIEASAVAAAAHVESSIKTEAGLMEHTNETTCFCAWCETRRAEKKAIRENTDQLTSDAPITRAALVSAREEVASDLVAAAAATQKALIARKREQPRTGSETRTAPDAAHHEMMLQKIEISRTRKK